jgi:hypothetical protein
MAVIAQLAGEPAFESIEVNREAPGNETAASKTKGRNISASTLFRI